MTLLDVQPADILNVSDKDVAVKQLLCVYTGGDFQIFNNPTKGELIHDEIICQKFFHQGSYLHQRITEDCPCICYEYKKPAFIEEFVEEGEDLCKKLEIKEDFSPNEFSFVIFVDSLMC